MKILGGISAETFLTHYWQKEPLLVRGALADFECPITPEELGGLALEKDVESRLIKHIGDDAPWEVKHGPFSEHDLTSLPDTHWTLLIQEVNKHVPEFAELQERFSFLPNWRLDDVMVSFAPAQGTVGPHADNYDVFIIQGTGRRRWQINRTEPADDDLIPDLPLKIMKAFQPEEEWVLEPGDMLYLPPGVAHHGVALEDSLSISVGYRAPTLGDLLSGFYGEAIAAQETEHFYRDPDLALQLSPGELSEQARAAIRHLVRTIAIDDASIDHWFGRYITDVRPGHHIPEPEQPLNADQFIERLSECGELQRSEYCRYAYIREGGESIRFYVAGEEYILRGIVCKIAELLANQRHYDSEQLMQHIEKPGVSELLTELYNMGGVYFPDE
jgi:50S ribosomal protein L16 3-hydroxylase